jgi:hypothetical protein
MGIASLVFGILAIISGTLGIITLSPFLLGTTMLFGAMAFIFGSLARRKKQKTGKLGIIFGFIAIIEFFIMVLIHGSG